VRVISGSARGAHLKSIESYETRPTTDRIKENMFNLIQHVIPGKIVLDLFSGSGALAVEALSRGAAEAVLVENSKKCYTVITENLLKTRVGTRARVVTTDVEQALIDLTKKGKRFDLILMDPPYSKGYILPVLEQIEALEILTSDGYIMIEHESSDSLPEVLGRLVRVKHRAYGRTSLSLYREEETS